MMVGMIVPVLASRHQAQILSAFWFRSSLMLTLHMSLSLSVYRCWCETAESLSPTYDTEVTRHLFGAKAVGDLTDVVAAVLQPQV